MDVRDASSPSDKLLDEFKSALNRVLSGQVLPPICMTFDIKITLALLDVAHAVRQGRPTQMLAVRACEEFACCAVNIASVDRSRTAPRRLSAPRDEARQPGERSKSRRSNPALKAVISENRAAQ